MAEAQAGAMSAPPQEQSQQQMPPEADHGAPKKDAPPAKIYQQQDVDRIVDKVRKNAARDAELRLRREYEARQQHHQEPKREAPKEDQAPKREDFETHEEFQQAQTVHTARRVAREERANAEKEAEEKRQREVQEKTAQSWHGRIQKTVEKHPDFETTLETNDDVVQLVASSPMREFITESDIGPEIVYELCKNPAEAKRIAALPRYKQAAAVEKIEERLTAAAPKADPKEEPKADADPKDEKSETERNADGTFKPKKAPSKAPEPIEPVGARGTGADSTMPSDKDDADTWRRKELARIRKLQGK